MYNPVFAQGYCNSQWVDILPELLVDTLLAVSGKYDYFFITLEYGDKKHYRQYRGTNLFGDFPNVKVTDTLVSWCERYPNHPLESFTDVLDFDQRKSAELIPIALAGIEILKGNLETHPENITDRDEVYHDLQLYRHDFEKWDEVTSNAVAVVDGLLCPIVDCGEYGKVLGGKRIIDTVEGVNVDLLSFADLGGIEVVPLSPLFNDEDMNLDRMTVNLHTENFGDCDFLLVLGGRLLDKDAITQWLDENTLLLKLGNVDLMSLVAEDYRRLAFPTNNPWWGGSLSTHGGIRKLLECHQSFLIKFRGGIKVFSDKTPLQASGVPNKYLANKYYRALIVRGDNRGVGHWVAHNGNPNVPYVVSTQFPNTPRLWEHTGMETDKMLLTGVTTPYLPARTDNLYFCHLYAFIGE